MGCDLIEEVGRFADSVDLWWLVAAAVFLILLDWMFLQTEALLQLGLAVLLFAALRLLFSDPLWIAGLIPLSLLVSFFLQPILYRAISRTENPYDKLGESLSGRRGRIVVRHEKNESSEFFYSYKGSISAESWSDTAARKLVFVELDDGQVFPVDGGEALSE